MQHEYLKTSDSSLNTNIHQEIIYNTIESLYNHLKEKLNLQEITYKQYLEKIQSFLEKHNTIDYLKYKAIFCNIDDKKEIAKAFIQNEFISFDYKEFYNYECQETKHIVAKQKQVFYNEYKLIYFEKAN